MSSHRHEVRMKTHSAEHMAFSDNPDTDTEEEIPHLLSHVLQAWSMGSDAAVFYALARTIVDVDECCCCEAAGPFVEAARAYIKSPFGEPDGLETS